MTTLALPHGFGVETDDAQRAYLSDPRDGVAFRRRVSARKIRRYRVPFELVPRGVYELVREAWEAEGMVGAMDWIDPDGNSLRVRFVEMPTVAFASHSHVSMSILLEEVL